MAKRLEIKGNYVVVTDTITGNIDRRLPSSRVSYDYYNATLHIIYINRYDQNYHVAFDDLVDSGNLPFVSESALDEFMREATGGMTGTMDVNVKKTPSPLIILKATELLAETTLTVAMVLDANTMTVASSSGASVGDHISVYSVVNNRVSFYDIIAINGNVVTLDTPIDFAYGIGDFVQFSNHSLAVDGSVTPKIFGVRNPTAQDVDLSVDITRMLLSMQLTSDGDYDEFGNIPRLTNGLVCRFVDSYQENIFNIKDNRSFDNLMYDLKFITAKKNSPDGLSGRFTFENLGSVIRLKPFEDLQFIVQDDLTALSEFEIIVQGKVVPE